MRKAIGWVLAFAIMLCFVGCASDNEGVSSSDDSSINGVSVAGKEYVGEWKANVATFLVDGVKTYSVYVIKLNEDGTGAYRDKDGKWEYNDTEKTIVLTLTDEKIGIVLKIEKDGEKPILKYYQDTYYRASDFTESSVGGVEGPTNMTVNESLLISSEKYYKFLTAVAEEEIKETIFSKYSIGIGEYPYFEVVYVVEENVTDDVFYEAAEAVAKGIYEKVIAVEYKTPPIYKYSYNQLSIEFYTEANRNKGANCTYQMTVDKMDSDKSFEENITVLSPRN